MKYHKTNFRLVVYLVTLLFFLLACGLFPTTESNESAPENSSIEPSISSDADENSPSQTIDQSEITPPPNTPTILPDPSATIPEETPSVEQDLAEQQIFILPGGEPSTLDPHLSGDATSAEYVVEIFSGLMTYDQELNLIPDIAESYTISDDGLVYTFILRPTAKFHDGKPITAADFKWSFERACDPATDSHIADTYLGDIVGCRDKLQGTVDAISGVTVIDDHTLEITIDKPKGFFLAKLTYPTSYVLDQENVEAGGSTWYTNPNGSGPFKLGEMSIDEFVITLEKNENYYRDPKPILNRVIYLVNAPINPMTGYEQNLAPLSENTSYDAVQIGTSNLSRATDPNNTLSQELQTVNQYSVAYIGFNTKKPPFDDPQIRQAFNLALDKQRIVKLAFQDAFPVANGIVPPNMPGYENPDLSDYEFDPERALTLIIDSPYEDPVELPEITLHVNGQGSNVGPVIEAIIESYQINLGINIAVEQSPWPEFLADLNSGDPSYPMYQLGWVADYPDPQNFLEVLFHSQSGQNHGGYQNPEVDAILDEARETQDPQARLALYQQAEQLILDDAAWVPLYFSVENWLVKPYVQGFVVPPMKIPKLQYISILEH